MFIRSRATLALAVTCLLLAPAAGASHWLLYYEGLETSPGATLEPDDAVVDVPGNPLHGLANRVTHAAPGDGGLFLDAVLGNYYGTGTAGITLYYGRVLDELLQRPDVVVAGDQQISAWYGWWIDKEQDGFIHDVHDVWDAPADEFVWKGGHTEEDAVVVASYVIPKRYIGQTVRLDDARVMYTRGFAPSDEFDFALLQDRTGLDRPEQGWVGPAMRTADTPLLSTVYTVVVADAPREFGNVLRYDVRHSEALVDVDRYEAVSQDVEMLYSSIALLAREIGADAHEIRAGVLGEVNSTTATLGVNDVRDDALARITETRAFAEAILENEDALVSWTPREPNDPADDSEGRAIFGGIGDRLGTGNQYPGHENAFGLYFDIRPRYYACAGAYAAVPDTIIELRRDLTCSERADLFLGGERGAGYLLNFDALAVLWKDLNGDGHVGAMCDPADPDEFDAEAGACREPPKPFGQAASVSDWAGEVRYVCPDITLRQETVTLTPVGGPWPNVVVLRDHTQSTRVAFDAHWEVRSDSGPIALRWAETCPATQNMTPRTRDALLFPPGSTIAVRVEGEVSISGYIMDGILFPSQTSRDVDLLPALL